MTPPIKDLLPRLTPILKNRYSTHPSAVKLVVTKIILYEEAGLTTIWYEKPHTQEYQPSYYMFLSISQNRIWYLFS